MKMKYFVFTALLLVSFPIVFAQQFSVEQIWDPQQVAQLLLPNMPEEWLRLPNVIYYLFIPFICVTAVIYGLMMELNIFRRASRKVSLVIALCFAFSLLPSGVLVTVVSVLYSFGAFFGALAFFALFIVGSALWAYGHGKRIYVEYYKRWEVEEKRLNKEITDLNATISQINRAVSGITDPFALANFKTQLGQQLSSGTNNAQQILNNFQNILQALATAQATVQAGGPPSPSIQRARTALENMFKIWSEIGTLLHRFYRTNDEKEWMRIAKQINDKLGEMGSLAGQVDVRQIVRQMGKYPRPYRQAKGW